MLRLEDLYAPVLAELPTEDYPGLTLNAENCPFPLDDVETTELMVLAASLGASYGDSAKYDCVHFFGDKATYRRLGLLLFASIFHPDRVITLYPRHPKSTVTKIQIECHVGDPLKPGGSQLISVPKAFGYEPEPPGSRYPLIHDWHRSHTWHHDRDFPWLELTNEDGRCGHPAEFASRSVVNGFGNPKGTAAVATLLLDIGLPQTTGTEFSLESPSGNWSVAIGSAEARFWVGYDFT